MWYESCFGTTMGSGDIEVVVKASTLKHINTDIIENTDKTKHAIETKIQCVLVSAVALVSE